MSFSGKPTTFVEQAIENDGFWPNLSLSEFQREQRLPAEYLVELLVDALSMAMVEVNADLGHVKEKLQAAGISSLVAAAGVATPTDWGYAHKVMLYKRAVYCRAKGQLLPQFATVTRRESAENTGKEAPERSETFLAFSQQAVRALQGRGRITASLQ
ncbi:head protein [Pseudomonas palleroniana]|uniref:Head completion/stabilization protein n=1 Tax=Pseudomonas palleroniana TaxID=191390 RepID=A0A1H5LPE0_9PSED|nr:head completion/stabilization protein [Pseudomonas palleroniana]KAB0566587.1 head completion/stabilization protein [Pseudomonas palleroniana]PTC25573.1 head protein [Pseudomonas palleroniana]SEE78892.1 Phage head completion protein (GPL) [Pseudomonas palleroniana]